MIKNTFNKFVGSSMISALLLAGGTFPVSALSVGADVSVDASVKAAGTGVNVEAKLQARITQAKSHADQEIDRRVSALTELNTRIQGMARVSADVKAQMSAMVTSEINNLTTLKTKVDADTDINTLKIDVKAVTQSYRIFALIIPAGQIAAMADKIKTTTDMMAAVGVKLQTRITAAQTAGKDTSALVTLLADYNAKLADAKAQADAALSLTASLTPDNGDEAKLQANKKALVDARAKLKLGETDLKTARQDADKILKALKATVKVEVKGGKNKPETTSSTEANSDKSN